MRSQDAHTCRTRGLQRRLQAQDRALEQRHCVSTARVHHHPARRACSAGIQGPPLGLLALMHLIRPQEPRKVKIDEIQRIVARRYNVSRGDLLSSRRTANVVRPRQIAMYLAKTLTLRSLPEIGRRFGGRDHTTVLHAVRKIEGLVGNDGALAEEIEMIKRELQE